MNEQAAVMIRWLLAGHGGLKNIAQLLANAFGPSAIAAASLDTGDGTIIAHPVDPSEHPHESGWNEVANGWAHAFDPPSMPHSATADHHVVVGITSRNELLVINLNVANHLGIEGAAPIPIMRSWMMQILSKTPTAQVTVTHPALHLPDTPRVTFAEDLPAVPASTTVIFTTDHTPAPESTTPLLVSSKATAADNELLCDDAFSGIYVANRYWPLWRRLELPDEQWATLTATINTTSTTTAPITARPPALPDLAAAEPHPATTEPEPETGSSPAQDVEPQEPPPAATARDVVPDTVDNIVAFERPETRATSEPPGPPLLVTSEPPGPQIFHPQHEATSNGHTLPGPPAPAAPPADRIGIYGLGETYVIGQDSTGNRVRHTAITRMGARRPVLALMMLATAPERGLARQQWDDLLHTSPANRRQVRTQIKKMMGGQDPITIDSVTERLVVPDLFCDWKEFQRLIGNNPMTADTDDLVAAITLVRGEPFSDLPHDDYNWRDYVLLKDQLVTQCGDAAMELARRQHEAGHLERAYQTARIGLSADPLREDLWTIAMTTVPEIERRGLLYDLKQAIPVPASTELRKLLNSTRTESEHTRKAYHG